MKQLIFTLLLAVTTIIQAQEQINDIIVENDSIFTVKLEDVTVTATRNMQRLSKGGLITDIKGTSLSNLGTCNDVIPQLPGIISNDENIEVIGRGAPRIYINGRKLVDKSELNRISSKELQNIEVIFNPGAKYGAETKSVILIKTIRKQGDGLSGSAQATGRLAHYISQAENLFLNYRTGGFDIFGSLNYDFARRHQKQHNITSISTPTEDYLLDSDIIIYPNQTHISLILGPTGP